MAMHLNWLDRSIEAVAPAWAVERGMARMQLDVLRKYEAAETGRRQSGWKAGSGSANAEVIPGLATVRNRCRQMVRDNEYAKAAVRTLATSIVGSTGINVIPENKAERRLWTEWIDVCDADGQLDFAGLQLLAAKTWKESGEVLARRRWRKPTDGLTVPLQIQLLEPDHLDHGKTSIDGDFVNIAGVQFNKLGARTGYWLFSDHPGEVASAARSLQSKLVPATEILHVYSKDRISQVRGVSALAVSLMRMRDLDGYEEAELVRKKIEACFTAFVTTDSPRMHIGDLKKEEGAPASAPRVTEKVSPGLIKYLTQGETVTFGSPQASGGYGEYTATQLHAIAVGAGVTYHQLTGDTSRANYTSHRAALVTFNQLIEAEQWLAFVPMFIKPIRRWWREAAQLNGIKVGKNPDRITTPKKPVVDPLKDTLADKEEIRAGLKSLSEALRERGMDPETVFAEIKTERDALAVLGLVFDTDATVTNLKLTPGDLLNAVAGKGAD
ncbi:phage portal protein [Roseateles sp. P5_E7]